MKSTFLKLALPMTLATLLANAEPLNPPKNLQIDSKTMMVNENSTFDNRINFGPGGLFNVAAGASYARIKPDSTYIGIATYIDLNRAIVTAMGGYNFLLSEKDKLTPSAGLGCFTGLGRHTGSTRIFPVVGLEYEHAFNSVFSVGTELVTVLVPHNSFVSLGVPFTFHFGDQKRWEFRLTPLVAAQHLPIFIDTVTFSASLGYRF
ncbi:MAG TPA: hypothetical protein VMR37_07785 [Rhabdochlamydiaceae bacterium]|nr:hypothetical protein [Rhabdochlamydiaceae bacterium]